MVLPFELVGSFEPLWLSYMVEPFELVASFEPFASFDMVV